MIRIIQATTLNYFKTLILSVFLFGVLLFFESGLSSAEKETTTIEKSLFDAVQCENTDKMRDLLNNNENIDFNYRSELTSLTILSLAVKNKDKKIIGILLGAVRKNPNHKISLDTNTDTYERRYEHTIFHDAVSTCKPLIFQELINYAIDTDQIHACTNIFHNVLNYAHTKIVLYQKAIHSLHRGLKNQEKESLRKNIQNQIEGMENQIEGIREIIHMLQPLVN